MWLATEHRCGSGASVETYSIVYFTALNGGRPPVAELAIASSTLNLQAHAFDVASLAESHGRIECRLNASKRAI